MRNKKHESEKQKREVDIERNKLLRNIIRITETPMIILGFLWLALLLAELLNKSNRILNTVSIVIWIIFILDFILKFILSPIKTNFLKKNVLTAISLIVPAVRVLRFVRIIRFFRISRGLRLVKVLGSLNRGMNALGGLMKRRAFGYVVIFTLIVMFVGAAGAYAFEREESTGFNTYSSSLWRTAMLIMNNGTEWPVTPEGRMLYLFIAIFSMAVLGYITATLATYFIGRDASKSIDIASAKQIESLRKEIAALKSEINSARSIESRKSGSES